MKKYFILIFILLSFNVFGNNIEHTDRGFHLESEDGKFSTNLQWRAQLRYAYPDDGDPRNPSQFTDEGLNNFELRRLRMKIGGHGFREWVKYYFEIDLQPSRSVDDDSSKSSSRIIDYRLDLQPTEKIGLRLGQWKINYNRERVDSSGRQQFVERSIVNRIFTIDRQVGVMVKGRLAKGTSLDMRYWAGLFNGEGRATDNKSTDLMKVIRLQWNPLGVDLKWRQSDVKYHRKAGLSIAAAYAQNKGPCTRWSSSGCGSLDGFSIGTSNQYEINQAVQETAFKYKGFSWQQELHWKEIDDSSTGLSHNYTGGYAQAGYFFNKMIPSIPKEMEFAVRFAQVNEPDSDDFSLDNIRREYTVATNYFISGHNNKITLDYSRLTLSDASSSEKFQDNRVRLQWDVSF